MAHNAIFLSGVVTNLNNNESSNKYLSANVSTLQLSVFVLSNLFLAKYR